MRLTKLTMINFMPYGGEHVLPFPTSERRNVMLVFGDNMRGKTSLLNAIRWCFYGRALGRHMKELDLAAMVNVDAAAKGDHQIAVYITFEADGVEYDLRRTAKPRELIVKPRSTNDFDIEVTLRKGTRVLRGDETDHELNQLFPEQISRFFLFDGELLQEYETLLADDSEQGKRIKTAIEQVLGVPALINGRDELRTLLREAQRVQARENKHIEAVRSVAEQQMQVQAEHQAITSDLAALRKREQDTVSEIEEFDEVLSATEAVQQAKAQIDSLKARRAALKLREQQLETEKLTIVRDSWKDLLQPRMQARIAHLVSLEHRQRAGIEQLGGLKVQIGQLRKLLASGACGVCGQEIESSRRSEIGAQLGQLEGSLTAGTASALELGTVTEELSRLSRLRAVGALERLRTVESELNRVAIEQTTIESEDEVLQQQIRGHDTAEISRVRALRDQRQQALGRVRADLGKRQEEADTLLSKQNELSRIMSKSASARSERSNREVELYSSLEKCFSRGVDVLRNQLRQQVGERATEAFLRLTTEKSFRGLKITDNYGLSIIDRDNRPVSIRSAGAEQIVALSLIDGLNKTAGKSGPIVMDTPLGRLDPKHRAAVLSEVHKLADQVVLLVHEGEIARGEELEQLASRIGAVYEIERLSSSQSRLVNVKADKRYDRN